MLSSPPHPTAPAPSAPRARGPLLLIALALAPLWLVGILDRGLWTPDEPREADMAWRMSWQQDRVLPQLAGTPFLEKPPLSYWMSAAAIRLWGDSPSAARAPGLLYALVTALAVGALALAMELELSAALIAALVAASALTVLRVTVWLAPDACLLAGCALALLGAWRGLTAPAGRAKLAGYTLLHLGAAIGFMAKSAPGWLVPALALLTLIVWERRWSELKRFELYAGLALQALIIGPWMIAVARSPHGSEALRTLFWNNVIGRFTQVAAPAGLDYTSGHQNTPGKYLLSLPVYLLPWTLVGAAALTRAWVAIRDRGPRGTAWRFAAAACIPFLIVLSLAATARDIYSAPALLGFGLLAGLWAADAQRAASRLDRIALAGTLALVLLLAISLALALALLAAAGAAGAALGTAAAIGVLLIAAAGLTCAVRALRGGALQQSVLWCYATYAATFCLAAGVAFPVIDRWQNLPALAARIHSDTTRASLALLDPDETTLAMLDHGLRTRFTVLSSAGGEPRPLVAAWLTAHGPEARVLVLLPGHAGGPVADLIGRFRPLPSPGDGVAAALSAAGTAVLAQRYELPQGRRYALLAPPPPH